MKFRKKPVVIEATQVPMSGPTTHLGVYPDAQSSTGLSIDTLEGKHEVTRGDWIITGVKGEKYPCKPDIFEMTYEKDKLFKTDFDDYIDHIVGKLKPEDPFAKIQFPIEFNQWQRDVMIVTGLLDSKLDKSPWYHEYKEDVLRIIAYSCLATKFINDLVAKSAKE